MSLAVLVTGATGFVGLSLLTSLQAKGYSVRAAVRSSSSEITQPVEQVIMGDLSSATDWSQTLSSVGVVVHLAARVHIMHDTVADPLIKFREVNVNATLNLARQAAQAGVKRFIFISSVKVNGELTSPGKPFTETDQFIPSDPYGLSKYEAEQGLLNMATEIAMEVTVIRPPLVYGPNVKANFAAMLKWANKNMPMPFGTIHNQRSLVALDNLTSFIIHCIDHPKAANEVFLIADSEDVSTTELLAKVAQAFDHKPRLIPIPVWLMTWLAKLIGKGEVANRVFGSLQVDSSKARELLGWQSVITMEQQLTKIADTYLENEKSM